MSNNKHIAVVGGGAAGLMAAGTARRAGCAVTLFEHNKKVGRKLLITGKGRCNLTNHCTPQDFLGSVTVNPHFLYSALHRLSPADTMALFESLGLPLKTERGQRVFPASDTSSDVLAALLRYAAGTTFVHAHVSRLQVTEGRVAGLVADGKACAFDAVILATGGMSYPLTGSDGSGYALAEELGHTLMPRAPSLVPINSDCPDCLRMQGLSLKNVALRIKDQQGNILYRDFGEMLFTHFGLSGPMVLSATAHLHRQDIASLTAEIDLKPALDDKTLDRRLLSDLAGHTNKDFANILGGLVPLKMIGVILDRTGIDPHTKCHSVTREQRERLLRSLKSFEVPLASLRPIEEAIVTRGGVSVKEIHPSTMMSKLVEGLCFAGEMIDVDAYTGGFNLQIAFSTGYTAGNGAAEYVNESGI